MSTRVIVDLLLVLVTARASAASALASPRTDPAPQWLVSAERQVLDRVFEHARPVHTYLIPYPQKIAVVWVFRRVVICGACSAPTNASLPRGRVIRVSFNRITHAVRESDGLRFCETRVAYPPLAECLRR